MKKINAKCDKCGRLTGMRANDDGLIWCVMCGHKYENIDHSDAKSKAKDQQPGGDR